MLGVIDADVEGIRVDSTTRGQTAPRGGKGRVVTDHARIAQLMGSAIVMLASAVEDVRRGRYSDVELKPLADGLDPLVAALRGQESGNARLVVDAERTDR